MLGLRAWMLLLAVGLSLPLAIGAYATAGHHSGSKKTSTSLGAANSKDKSKGQSEGTGDAASLQSPGGTSCFLPDGGSALSADWTHGDYVSAWSHWAAQQKQQGLSTKTIDRWVKVATQSDCGTPASSASSNEQSGESHGNSSDAHTRGNGHKP